MKTPMEQIDRACEIYSIERDDLTARVTALQDEIKLVEKKHLKLIREAVRRAAAKELDLKSLLEGHPELFLTTPRTVIFHGIKVGYGKRKGKIIIAKADKDKVIAKIRSKFKRRFDELVKTAYAPILGALNKLPAQDLKSLGIEVTESTDGIILAPINDAIDELVAALLENATAETEESVAQAA